MEEDDAGSGIQSVAATRTTLSDCQQDIQMVEVEPSAMSSESHHIPAHDPSHHLVAPGPPLLPPLPHPPAPAGEEPPAPASVRDVRSRAPATNTSCLPGRDGPTAPSRSRSATPI